MNLMIVPGMLVCNSFLISVCIFIVSKALLISSATVIVSLQLLKRMDVGLYEMPFVCIFVGV